MWACLRIHATQRETWVAIVTTSVRHFSNLHFSVWYTYFTNCSIFAVIICSTPHFSSCFFEQCAFLTMFIIRRWRAAIGLMCSKMFPCIHLQQTRQREVCSSTFIQGNEWEPPRRHKYSQKQQLLRFVDFGIHLSGCSYLHSLLTGLSAESM